MKIRFYCGDCAAHTYCHNRGDKMSKICEHFRVGWRCYITKNMCITVAQLPTATVHGGCDVEFENEVDQFKDPINLTLTLKTEEHG